MTLEESAALMIDPTFISRVKVAALSYATNLNLQAGLARSRQLWIQQTLLMPDATASQLVPATVMNVNVQGAGASVTDENLQAAVQVVADSMM